MYYSDSEENARALQEIENYHMFDHAHVIKCLGHAVVTSIDNVDEKMETVSLFPLYKVLFLYNGTQQCITFSFNSL